MHRNVETSVEISENSSIELMDVEGKKSLHVYRICHILPLNYTPT